jgi:hypothetical protein
MNGNERESFQRCRSGSTAMFQQKNADHSLPKARENARYPLNSRPIVTDGPAGLEEYVSERKRKKKEGPSVLSSSRARRLSCDGMAHWAE